MGTPVLDLSAVVLVRGGRRLLDGVDLHVEAGEHWALIGPNGAGKSTLLSICGAHVHPTSGVARILGAQLGRVEVAELRRAIGHVDPRHDLRSPLTIREVVLTGVTSTVELPMRRVPSEAELAHVDAIVASLGLADRADHRWPTLSQGERGRALIGRALVGDPALLLLDEPATGLDVAARERLLETVDALRATRPAMASLLVTHHLEELPTTTTHAALVAGGRVVAAGPADDVLTTERVSACFEHPIAVERRDGRWSARAGRTGTIAVG